MILSCNYATVLPEPSLTKKKNIKTCKLKCFQWKYFKHHYWNFRRYDRNIYLPQSLYQNSGSFLFLLARTNVFSTNKTQRTSFLISQAHPHILKLICWNKFLYKKKITAFQTLYWSNIHVFLCLFILKTSFKNYSFLLLFLRDPLEHMRHFVWQF